MTKPSEIKVNYQVQYLVFQLIGWGGLLSVIALFNAKDNGFSFDLILFLASVYSLNLLLSHGYRLFVNKKKWLLDKLSVLLLKIGIASILLGILFSVIINSSNWLIFNSTSSYISLNDWLFGSVVYFLWSLLYFGYLLFYKARIIEFKNIQLQALNAETELKNLRSQLNPHFMFNAMNSIRALIDENPVRSKEAVTQLSNVLRNSLVHTKKELVSLSDEMTIVSDYLSLEKIRYEERLVVLTHIQSKTNSYLIPPLLIQTLVENAIKHGISKLKQGGELEVSSREENGFHVLEVVNSGKLGPINKSETNIGIQNTQKRLKLIYGKSATFQLKQIESKVVAQVILPLNKQI